MPNVRVYSDSRIEQERPDLFRSALEGVQDVTTVQRLPVDFEWFTDDDADGYFTDTLNRAHRPERKQVFLDQVLLDFANNTQMGDFGELDFALVTPDIFSEDTNFVFGMTVEPWKLSVQSIARFVAATADEDLQRASIRHLAKHEFAHMRGLADPEDFDNPQRDAGGTKLYDGHCANTCSLQQVMSVPETFQLIEVLPEDEAGFCVSCVSALISKREE